MGHLKAQSMGRFREEWPMIVASEWTNGEGLRRRTVEA
jgi:hypothetical protein